MRVQQLIEILRGVPSGFTVLISVPNSAELDYETVSEDPIVNETKKTVTFWVEHPEGYAD